jgi:hypothetical protein
MKLLQETTSDWNTPTPNHIYIFEKTSSLKALGYIKSGTNIAVRFSTPMQFDKRRRTFKEVPAKGFDLSALTLHTG